MAELKNCKKCGRLFNYFGGTPICHECRNKDEEDFQNIKKYLHENPGASISQVSKELDITIEKIKRFLRDGRLEIVGDEGIPVLYCEKCGDPINTGRFCETCSRDMSKKLSSLADNMKGKSDHVQKQNTSKMRYFSRNGKKR